MSYIHHYIPKVSMAKVNFTASRVTEFKCPEDKSQVFLWDSAAPGLGIRATPRGTTAYIFQTECQGKTLRMTIGGTNTRNIAEARIKARELQAMVDDGRDPRLVKAEIIANDAAKREQARAKSILVAEAWAEYIEARRDKWGDRHYKDHLSKAKAGGAAAIRGTRGRGVTIEGPLHGFMSMPLSTLDARVVETWAQREGKTRPTAARLAWRLLKVFLGWCAEHPQYCKIVPAINPAKTKRSREALGKAQVKSDVLHREQLSAWFAAVRSLKNPAVATALQTILLTGARPGEVLDIKWEDIDLKWKGLTIKDKVEGIRTIPLTPYLADLLIALPKRSEWVFAGTTGRPIASPNHALSTAAQIAGIEGLTLHGLRRSFKSLTEWLEVPTGVVAQIMGHKPSATAEKHYTVRPLDLIRVHHEKIEAWILEQGGISFSKKTHLNLVAAA
jgi:integrase